MAAIVGRGRRRRRRRRRRGRGGGGEDGEDGEEEKVCHADKIIVVHASIATYLQCL